MANEDFPLQKECEEISKSLDNYVKDPGRGNFRKIIFRISDFIGKMQAGLTSQNQVRLEIEKICGEFFSMPK